ncbi:MAG: glycosyltransferase family 4 protein [Bacteroidales bacterium]|nr:glycosyltransferase family 4 protein [Bacteroidales bacterium]
MRILYECDLAGSSVHGMAYRIFQFSREFQKKGHEVSIIGASFSHVRQINPVVKDVMTDEIIDGIKYRWIKTPKYTGNGIGRVVHMLIYNIRLFFYAGKIAEDFRPDVIISSGVSPFDFIGCNRIARKANAKILLEVGDLWPLSPIELGGYSKYHPFIIALQFAENFSFKKCDAVISILPKTLKYMLIHGLKPGKFHYIPNGIYTYKVGEESSLPEEYEILINKLKSEENTLIAYTGAHGIANDLDSLIVVADKLKDENIVFLLVGSGPEKEKLMNLASEINLRNIFFLNSIPKKSIPVFLNKMDILYLGLQKQPLFRFGISPNKIFDYMMSGKPIVQAIEAGNNLVEEAKCGISAEPENIENIASAILHLRNLTPAERDILGKNGQAFVKANHSYDILTDKYLKVLESVVLNKE